MTTATLARALRRDALSRDFDAAGVAFKCLGGPIAPSLDNTPIVQLDVHETPRCGEYIRLWPGAADNQVEVVARDRSLGQVVLRVREKPRPFTRPIFRSRWHAEGAQEAEIAAQGGTLLGHNRSHFFVRFFTPDEERLYLCGRDEQRLFVAQLPPGPGLVVDSVAAAHQALKPRLVRLAEETFPGAVVRQGEWFFIPPSAADACKLADALSRDPHALRAHRSVGAGGEARPHVADEVVVLRRSRPRGELRMAPATVTFARGEVRHVDHFPVRLPDFCRVVLNTAVQPGRDERRLRWFD
jgi:hypothetical protein